jgi:two-component system response regulator YesN
MKVILADDEYLARSSLKSMLKELNTNIELVGEAANGEDLITLVKKYQPEIAFVDIKMPKLSGLEGIKIARLLSPDTKWVILSGFSNFQFAQEALRLGSYDYLLKPVSPEELSRVLNDLALEHSRQLALLNRQFETDLMALFYGLSSLSREEADSFILNSRYWGAILYIDSALDESTKASSQLALLKLVRQNRDENLTNNRRIALLTLPAGELTIVAAWKQVELLEGKPTEEYLKQLTHLIQQANRQEFRITTLSSGECLSYQELRLNLGRLHKLSSLRAILGVGHTWNLKVLSHYEVQKELVEAGRLLTRLGEYYKERDYLNYSNALDLLQRNLSHSRLLENNKTKKQAADFLNCSIGCTLEPMQSLELWIKTLQRPGERLLAENNRDKEREDIPDLISQMLTFIENNYRYDIGITQIAEQLNVTPNYLSSLFHKKTGQTFMKYLTRTRLLKAQELLSSSNLQIQQVAEQVGYYSTRHFTKLFTEFSGCYPSEYRKKLGL